MVKVKVIEGFTLKRFNELINIKRKNVNDDEKGKLYIGDEFECELEMFKYLTGENKEKRAFVEKIGVTSNNRTKRITKKLSTNKEPISIDKKTLQKSKDYDKIPLDKKRLNFKNNINS